jgi:hypothetical protein
MEVGRIIIVNVRLSLPTLRIDNANYTMEVYAKLRGISSRNVNIGSTAAVTYNV